MSNTRECPFHGCGRMIDPELFACKDHWSLMTEKDRKVILRLYEDWKCCVINSFELTQMQSEVLLRYQPAEKPKEVPLSQDSVKLAKKVKQYIAKRKEYTACKDGYLEQKRKIGMELSRLESELVKACDEILHTKQVQPTLFDAGTKDKGVPD